MKIFLSYASEQSELAKEIVFALQTKAKIQSDHWFQT